MAAITATGADAGEMKSLTEYMAQPEENVLLSYVMDRCSGLLYAMAGRGGVEQFGQENYDQIRDRAGNFFLVSASWSHEQNGGSVDDWADATAINIKKIVVNYNALMVENYASTGAAFGDLIRNDALVCKQFRDLG